MIINYFCWSTLISMAAIFLLYPLRHHSHGTIVSRFCASVFLFPSLISSVVTITLIYRNEIVLNSITRFSPLLKLYFGIQLSESNIAIIFCANLSMAMFIFLSPNRKFQEYFPLLSLCLLFIVFTASIPDHFVRTSSFSLGTIIITYMIISEERDQSSTIFFSRDFLINRISDLLAFMALIHLVFHLDTFTIHDSMLRSADASIIPHTLFVLAIVFRVASIIGINDLSSSTQSNIRFLIFYRHLVGIGGQILLILYSLPTYVTSAQMRLFFLLLCALIAFAFINMSINRFKFFSFNNFVSLIYASNLLIIALDYKAVATGIICLMITIFPLTVRTDSSYKKISSSLRQGTSSFFALMKNIFVSSPQKLVLKISSLVINAINLIYAGFILYRLPQVLLATLQMPLRFLNNGSMQRSLLFVVLMLIAYAYWWKQ